MAEKTGLTPMMRQYLQIKGQHPDCLVFFRLGDFYEMFFEDAKTASKELGLTLTTRDRNKPPEEQVPMCGVPYHAVQGYLAKLAAKGYKVVICEQMEDPALAQGLVDRDVTRIVTPGTLLAEDALEAESNNFLCAIHVEKGWAGAAFCDLSTGESVVLALPDPQDRSRLLSELESRKVAELVMNEGTRAALESALAQRMECHLETLPDDTFTLRRAAPLTQRQFPGQWDKLSPALNGGADAALCALGGALTYLYSTQRVDALPHLKTLSVGVGRTYMELDHATRRNLELTETIRAKDKKGSLLWVMDKCRTPMGHRRLRAWVERPLVEVDAIVRRQDGVAELVADTPKREALRAALSEMGDLERAVARLGCGTGNAKELLALCEALAPIPTLKAALGEPQSGILNDLRNQLDPLRELQNELDRAIEKEELPATVRDGGMIADGYDPQVDHYRALLKNGGQAMADIEADERERTGIKSLKVKYNKVFGYYIEVSNAYKGQVPEDYDRKQTLVNAERYITPRLKELEEEILNAKDRVAELEYQLFCDLRAKAVAQTAAIQLNADAAAQLDVLASLAALAIEERYVRPTVDGSKTLDIVDGRHPVVEKTLTDGLFVPNDVQMDAEKWNVALITGPNMAGKSTYMRQIGLIVLMAQMGSFVPARAAHIGVADRVFTRIGASDDLAGGQSTFMVEMLEVSQILAQATDRSLLLLDEIGRGTSTLDGACIARSVMEYCADTLRARTFFATHYHALCPVAHQLVRARNFSIAAQKRGDRVVFLRKIITGAASESYGIEVALLADVPAPVVERAKELMKNWDLKWNEG